MHTCIYCRSGFEEASEEHVLQNFLGARWDTPRIACNQCQEYFGQTVDVAFERGLQPIRNLFGTRGGRGGEGPTLQRLTTTAGEPIDLEPGGVPRLREPAVLVTPLPDGRHDVRIRLGHQNQLGWALKKLRDELPEKTIDEATVRHLMRATQSYLAGAVHLELKLGGLDFFRGLVKSAFNLLAAHSDDGPAIALDSAFDPVRAFIRHGHGEMPEFVRWLVEDEVSAPPTLGPIDQAVGLTTRRTSVEGVVQLFGHILFPIRLTDAYAQRFISCGYIVDPFREVNPAERRLGEFPEAAIPSFADQSPENCPEVQALFHQKLQRLLNFFYERAEQTIVRDTFTEILGPATGQPFTEELANQLAARLAEKIEPLMRRTILSEE